VAKFRAITPPIRPQYSFEMTSVFGVQAFTTCEKGQCFLNVWRKKKRCVFC